MSLNFLLGIYLALCMICVYYHFSLKFQLSSNCNELDFLFSSNYYSSGFLLATMHSSVVTRLLCRRAPKFHLPSPRCLGMYSKQYLIGPLDNVDQRGNHLNRVLDKLDRDVTMRVWEETCKVVDEVNKGSPLERRELPVIFIKEYRHTPVKLPEYPARDVPSVIQPGTLMWWSIDDVFEYLINPGYALFATTENVREYSVADVDGADGAAGQDQGHGDADLKSLMKELVMRSEGEVRLGDIVRFLVDENNLFLSSDTLIKMPSEVLRNGEHEIVLMVDSNNSERFTVSVS